MKRSIQHEPLLVQQFQVDHGSTPAHAHNHYELILIQTGSGYHFINGNRFSYQTGDVFFLGPSDNQSLQITQKTCFYSLSFTPLYLSNLKTTSPHSWHCIEQPLLSSRTEQRNLLALAEIVVAEQQSLKPLSANPIVESLMKTILSFVDRLLGQHPFTAGARQSASSELTQRIIAYVCQHITEPDLLRMERLADVFNYSASHLGALFKEQVGESIQQYIIRYKLERVETRLSLSTMSISQIADEFGFSDVCHLNKLFKRYYHRTPTTYRRSLAIP